MDDNLYNLMEQVTTESQSLVRMKNDYKKDAGSDNELVAFWDKMIKDKNEHIKELQVLLKKRMD